MRMRTSTVLLYKIKQLPTPPRTHGRQNYFCVCSRVSALLLFGLAGTSKARKIKKNYFVLRHVQKTTV
jgi:hypothetical protein